MATKGVHMDEREMESVGTAAVIALSVAFLYELGMAFWKFFSSGQVEAASSEIVFLVVVATVFVWVLSRRDESLMLPRVGSDDPDEMLSGKARKVRMKRYLLSSAGMAVAFTLMSAFVYFVLRIDPIQEPNLSPDALLANPGLLILIVLADLVAQTLIFFSIYAIWGEHEVRRYVRRVQELEN